MQGQHTKDTTHNNSVLGNINCLPQNTYIFSYLAHGLNVDLPVSVKQHHLPYFQLNKYELHFIDNTPGRFDVNFIQNDMEIL